MQKKLIEILRENISLKETLKYNTLFVQEQINILLLWKTKIMETYKDYNNKSTDLEEQNDIKVEPAMLSDDECKV